MKLKKNINLDKLRGGFYTPETITKFILAWAFNGNKFCDILEPSCGDGAFLKSLKKGKYSFNSVTAIEYYKEEAQKAQKVTLQNTKVIISDFHKYCNTTSQKFDIVIGNPPYIRYQYFDKEQQQEALKIFKNRKIDILLTDIKMPFMDGIKLMKEIHKEGWSPVCIIYSAYGEFEYAQNAIVLGVIQYLLKPVRLNEFKSLFEKVLVICRTKKEQEEQNQAFKMQLETVENIQLGREILRVLDTKDETISELLENVFIGGKVPVILSSYSYLFTKYWKNYRKEIKQIVSDEAIIINRDDTQTLILVSAEVMATQSKAKKVCEDIIKMSKNKYSSELFIVAGNVCNDIKELRNQYNQMKDQLDYQFFVSGSTYFLSDQTGFVRRESDMLSIYFKKILTCAKLHDFEEMKQEYEKAFSYVENNVGFSSIYVKYNFSEVIKETCELLGHGKRIMQVMEDIYGANSIDQVRNAVHSLIDKIAVLEIQDKDENRIVQLTRQYIQENYREITLSVSVIADELNISAAYLSTLFKKETGQTLIKYISWYRIEKAKELLKTTTMKVGDIAEKVGYVNASYFISLFRNNVGCSPAKYRENEYEE